MYFDIHFNSTSLSYIHPDEYQGDAPHHRPDIRETGSGETPEDEYFQNTCFLQSKLYILLYEPIPSHYISLGKEQHCLRIDRA